MKSLILFVLIGFFFRQQCVHAAVFAPTSLHSLKENIKLCLAETPDGSCPDFAAQPGNGVIGDWDVSKINSLHGAFKDEINFNADLSKWDVANVSNMTHLFYNASGFNRDLSKWDVSNVVDMESMFHFAQAFNSDVSNWKTSNVVNMKELFKNSGFSSDVSKWNISKVHDHEDYYYEMFANSAFDRTLCGAKWMTIAQSYTNGPRTGCCPAGSYMSNPHEDFSAQVDGTGSCAPCPLYKTENGEVECSLYAMVLDYLTNPTTTKAKYGPIADLNTSEVTDMSGLFCGDKHPQGSRCAHPHPLKVPALVDRYNADLSKWVSFFLL